MNRLPIIIAAGLLACAAAGQASSAEPGPADITPEAISPASGAIWDRLYGAYRPDDQAQVRIERRVIVRISPGRAQSAGGEGDEAVVAVPVTRTTRFSERPMGRCVPVREISSTQALRERRLLFIMRDRQIVSASLQKGCRARDFYSGFYVERSNDGLICVRRDLLQSRAGAKCEINQLRRFIPVGN